MAYEIGKTIIDELKLCYVADMTVLEDLASINSEFFNLIYL